MKAEGESGGMIAPGGSRLNRPVTVLLGPAGMARRSEVSAGLLYAGFGALRRGGSGRLRRAVVFLLTGLGVAQDGVPPAAA